MRLAPLARPWLAACLVAAAAGPAAAAPAPAGKPIDIVLCLDVSGSMNGLIDSAKLKLWDIVNELARVKPTPDLRVALYSYGHSTYPQADGWVRKDVDLTADLDEVYKALNALRTGGGEELCARVSKAALDQQKWSTDAGALKLIFVCGNESADQDKQFTAADVAGLAAKQGVIVNTIYCGSATHGDAKGWEAFAVACGGKYLNIDQNRAAQQVAVATEFDKEILELNGKLNGTYVAFGARERQEAAKKNQYAQDANAAGAGAPGAAAPTAALARASSKASDLYRNNWCLVDQLKNNKDFDLSKVKEEDLPDELKALKPDERMAYLKKKLDERTALQAQINELSAKRQKKVEEELAKQPKSAGEQALDEAVRGTIRSQAAAKGFEVPPQK